MAAPRLTRDNTTLLLIDMQARLLPVIDKAEEITARCATLIQGLAALDIPMIVTEQVPDKLGPTVAACKDPLPEATPIYSKSLFSAATDEVKSALEKIGRPIILLAGIETHVCVQQTALDLCKAGYLVGLVQDTISSRKASDRTIALSRLTQIGCMPLCTEGVLLELVGDAANQDFKKILPLIK